MFIFSPIATNNSKKSEVTKKPTVEEDIPEFINFTFKRSIPKPLDFSGNRLNCDVQEIKETEEVAELKDIEMSNIGQIEKKIPEPAAIINTQLGKTEEVKAIEINDIDQQATVEVKIEVIPEPVVILAAQPSFNNFELVSQADFDSESETGSIDKLQVVASGSDDDNEIDEDLFEIAAVDAYIANTQ